VYYFGIDTKQIVFIYPLSFKMQKSASREVNRF